MRNWSIDLETLDVRPTAAIIAIGAVQFDRDTAKIGIKHYAEITFDSAIKAGTVSGGTLAWWAEQSERARRVFGKQEKKTPLACALEELSTLMRSKSTAPIVWGNGASFDISILEHAYHNGAHGLAVPWDYTNIRDMRTLVDMADHLGMREEDWPERSGTHHNAVDDAEHQARVISACWNVVTRDPGATKKQMVSPPAKPVTTPDDDEDDEL